MECKEEALVLFATSVAMQLSKGLSLEELEDLRCLINQVSCSISSLISQKYSFQKKRINKTNESCK